MTTKQVQKKYEDRIKRKRKGSKKSKFWGLVPVVRKRNKHFEL